MTDSIRRATRAVPARRTRAETLPKALANAVRAYDSKHPHPISKLSFPGRRRVIRAHRQPNGHWLALVARVPNLGVLVGGRRPPPIEGVTYIVKGGEVRRIAPEQTPFFPKLRTRSSSSLVLDALRQGGRQLVMITNVLGTMDDWREAKRLMNALSRAGQLGAMRRALRNPNAWPTPETTLGPPRSYAEGLSAKFGWWVHQVGTPTQRSEWGH